MDRWWIKKKTWSMLMEEELLNWIKEEQRNLRSPQTRTKIREKAKILAANRTNFKASKGWLGKFIKRNNLVKDLQQELDADLK